MANAGTVSVRFSVENAEVVRQALLQLGNDGEKALRQLAAAGKPVPQTTALMGEAIGQVRGQAQAFANQLGNVGGLMLSLGPVGLVAAGAMGGLYLAFKQVADGAKQFAAYIRQLRDGGAQAGLAGSEFQALTDLFQQHGVEIEKTSAALNKFSSERDAARRGQGELYAALRRVNTGLAEQFASASSNREALDVLAQAMSNLGKNAQDALGKLAFGKGSGGISQAMLDLAGRGGVGAVIEALRKAGIAIDDNLIDRMGKAAAEADRRSRLTEQAWNSAYAAIFERWKNFKKDVLGLDPDGSIKIALKIERFVREGVDTGAIADRYRQGQQPNPDAAAAADAAARRLGGRRGRQQRQAALPSDLLSEFGAVPPPPDDIPLPRARPVPPPGRDEQADALLRESQNLKELIGFLGSAATPMQQFQARQLELHAAVLRGTLSQQNYNTALGALQLALDHNSVATRQQLGVANEQETVAVRLAELQKQRADGFIRSDDEMALAERLMRREVEQTMKALAVRRSEFPGLTKYGQDAADLRAQVDQFSVSQLDNVNKALVELQLNSGKAGEAWTSFKDQLIRAGLEIFNKRYIFGPLANAATGVLDSLIPRVAGPGQLVPVAGGGYGLKGIGPVEVPVAHGGGVIGLTDFPTRRTMLERFAGARHYGIGSLPYSLGHDEVPVIAHRGEVLGWPQQMRSFFGGGDQRPMQVKFEPKVVPPAGYQLRMGSEPDGRGGVNPVLMFDQISGYAASKLARPGTSERSGLLSSLGLREPPRKRS